MIECVCLAHVVNFPRQVYFEIAAKTPFKTKLIMIATNGFADCSCSSNATSRKLAGMVWTDKGRQGFPKSSRNHNIQQCYNSRSLMVTMADILWGESYEIQHWVLTWSLFDCSWGALRSCVEFLPWKGSVVPWATHNSNTSLCIWRCSCCVSWQYWSYFLPDVLLVLVGHSLLIVQHIRSTCLCTLTEEWMHLHRTERYIWMSKLQTTSTTSHSEWPPSVVIWGLQGAWAERCNVEFDYTVEFRFVHLVMLRCCAAMYWCTQTFSRTTPRPHMNTSEFDESFYAARDPT